MLRSQYRLGDLIEVKHGFAFPGQGFSEDSNFPTLVTPGNFSIGGGFKETKAKTFTGEYPDEYELSAGDLIVTMTDLSRGGDTLGYPAIVPKTGRYLHNQRIGLVRVSDASRIDLAFLNYYLRTSPYRTHILGTATGSTVRHTSPSRICGFMATVPELAEQRAIAEVLGALDDKIAANHTTGRIAVELADALFAATVAGVPVSGITFDELASIGGGGTPKTSVAEYWSNEVNWATPTDITALNLPYLRSTSRSISKEGLAACSSTLYPKGSILMTSRATIGAFAIAEIETAVNQGFIVVNAKEPHLQWWLFHEMRSRIDEFISYANGATFLELPRGKFKKLPVRLASPESMHKFADEAKPLHELAAQIANESQILANTRDELLPLLMSGKLRVKDAEKKVEAIV